MRTTPQSVLRQIHRKVLAVGLLPLILAPALVRAADGVAPEQATFAPGKETKILDPKTGGVGWYVVYVPKDYAPDREWPTMVCYHGKNNDPKTWPFKEGTDGQGWIILGMEYLDREKPDPATDLANLKRIRAFLGTKLKMNAKLLFMGGFSQGGWSTSRFSDSMLDELAGFLIMGAGGSPGANAARLKDVPVFVGIGEKDPANKSARDARAAYEAKGVAMTFAEWPGLEHNCDTKDKALKDWLLKHGPQNSFVAAFDAARAVEKSGKLGEAYGRYAAAATMHGGEEAAAAAKRIGDAADAKLAEAEAAVGARRYRDAVKLLAAVAKAYAGSPMAARAEQRAQQIQADPAIKADVEQAALDAKADETDAQAAAAEKAKDFARALSLYEAYVAQFPKATHFAAVKARYDALKANKSALASARQQAAERECKGWLSAADSYINADQPAKAKPFLQRVVEKYGDTEWAAEAKRRLATIK